MQSSIRFERISQRILRQINLLISSGYIRDRRVSDFLTACEINLSSDLRAATIIISSLSTERQINKGVEALNHASGYLQRQIVKSLNLRVTPKLYFRAASSLRNSLEVARILTDFPSSR